MAELEKVVKGLEEEIHRAEYVDESYLDCVEVRLLRDALALLKEQEPRVMTREEVNKHAGSLDPDPIFVEWKGTRGTAWVAWSIYIIADMLNAGNRNVRAWTFRPSPEQMKNTPWEGDAE